jgi:hypothetical protein
MSSNNNLLQHLVPSATFEPEVASQVVIHAVEGWQASLWDEDNLENGRAMSMFNRLIDVLVAELGPVPEQAYTEAEFETVYMRLGGKLIWAGEMLSLTQETCMQMAILPAVTATRKGLKMKRAPNGYNISELTQTLKRYYQVKKAALKASAVALQSTVQMSLQQEVKASDSDGTQEQKYGEKAPKTPSPQVQMKDASSSWDNKNSYHDAQGGNQRVSDRAPRKSQGAIPDFDIASVASDESSGLIPEFDSSGPIKSEDRRSALKLAKELPLPAGGPYKGIGDTRPLRRILVSLRHLAQAECLNPLEYQAVLNAMLSDHVRELVPAEACTTYELCELHVRDRISMLVRMFCATDRAERLQLRREFASIQQRFDENLVGYVMRFDGVVKDIRGSSIAMPDEELRERFIQSLVGVHAERAAISTLSNPSLTYEMLRAQLLSLAQLTSKPQVAPRGTGRDPQNEPKSAQPVRGACFKCGKIGHRIAECPLAKMKQGSTGGESIQRSQKTKESYTIEILHTDLQSDKRRGGGRVSELYDSSVPHIKCKFGHLEDCCLLADSGAPCGLLSQNVFNEMIAHGKYVVESHQEYVVRGAFGNSSKSNKLISIPVTYSRRGEPVTKMIQFLLVPELNRPAILGREALSIIGITMTFKSTEDEEGTPVDEYPESPPEVEVLHVGTEAWPYVLEDPSEIGLEPLQPEKSDSRIIDQVTHELEQHRAKATQRQPELVSDLELQTEAERLLDCVKDMGALQFSAGYTVRLTPVRDDDRDTGIQRYRFVISWELTDVNPGGKSWNSQSLIDKLPEPLRQEWDKHVKHYQDHGWWKSDDRSGDFSRELAAVVFPVEQSDQKSTRCRPCTDFRRLNKISPTVSATTTSVADAAWTLRGLLTADPDMEIRQFDLEKAFYKIGTSVVDCKGQKVTLSLRVGSNNYTSNRLVFGLAVGPSGLNVSQSILNTIATHIQSEFCDSTFDPSKKIIVMDDYLFVGKRSSNQLCARVMDVLWNLTGFDSPESKRSVWSTDQPVRWLGNQWLWDGQAGSLTITRPELEDTEIPRKWTKRVAFRVAGKITPSVCSMNESIARLHCDTIRALAGKEADWDTVITSEVARKLRSHLQAAHSHYEMARLREKQVYLLRGVTEITISTDASLTGFGFVVTNSDRILYTYGKLFGSKQWIWHINRKELFSLSQSLQKFDCLLYGFRDLQSIVCRTDSRVALAHMNEYKEISSKSIERRVILRLRRGILDLVGFWKQYGLSFTISYVKGTDNISDGLSRVATQTHSELEVDVNEVAVAIAANPASLQTFDRFRQWLIKRRTFKIWGKSEESASGADMCGQTQNSLRKFFSMYQALDERCRDLVHRIRKKEVETPQGEYSPRDYELRFLQVAEDSLLTRRIERKSQVWIPDSLIKEMIEHFHRSQGHCSLVDLLASFFIGCYHPHARKIAKAVIGKCVSCQLSNGRPAGVTSYGPIKRPPYPGHTIGVDLFGPLSRRSGYSTGQFILTMVDRLTGYTQFHVLKNGKAEAIVRVLERVLLTIGARTRVIVSDNGAQFVSSTSFPAFLASWGIRHRTIPIYTPSAGGFYEAKHKTAVHVLRTLLMDYPLISWQVLASIAQQKINSKVSEDRTVSPHELIFGWPYVWPTASAMESVEVVDEEGGEDPFTTALALEEAKKRNEEREKFLILWAEEFEKRQDLTAERSEAMIPKNRVKLEVGDQVMFAKDIIKKKFSNQCDGPFTIVQRLGTQTWKVKENKSGKIFVFHSRRLRRLDSTDIDSMLTPEAEEPEVPMQVQERDESQGETFSTVDRSRPVIKKVRFVDEIEGSVSRYGRVRRGSMSRNFTQ